MRTPGLLAHAMRTRLRCILARWSNQPAVYADMLALVKEAELQRKRAERAESKLRERGPGPKVTGSRVTQYLPGIEWL